MKLYKFLKDESGGVIVTTAVAVLALVVASGAAIDLGQQQLLRTRTQQATDTAALAAATFSGPEFASAGVDAQQVALRYFNLNFSTSYAGVNRPSPSISGGPGTLAVSASSTINTSFMNAVGTSQASAGSASTVGDVTNDVPPKYEVILVLDHSSTTGLPESGVSRLAAFKTASASLSQLILTTGQGHRIGAVKWNTSTTGQWPLTDSKTAIDSFTGGMTALGGSNISSGLTTAQTVAGGFNSGVVKVVILVTDGPNDSTTYDAATTTACANLKNSGIFLYTVGYGSDIAASTAAQTLLQSCASPNPRGGRYFYSASTPAGLSSIFEGIIKEVRKVRISQ